MSRIGRILGAIAGASAGALLVSRLLPPDGREGAIDEGVFPPAMRWLGPVLTGAVYGVGSKGGARIGGGVAYGLATYVAVFVLGRPALGLSEPEWDQPSARVGRRILACVITGLFTSFFASKGGFPSPARPSRSR